MMRKFAFASVFAAGSASGQRSAADIQQADSPPLALPPLELNETFLDDKKTEEKENEGLGSNVIVAERHTVNSLLTTCYERYFSSSSISPPHNDGDGSDRRDSATLESIGRSVAASEQQRQSSSSNRANDRIAHCAHALFNTSGTSSSISRVEFDSIVADVQERVEDRDLVEEVLDNLRPSHKKKKEEAKKKKNSLPSIPLSKNIAANLPPNDPKWDSLRAKFCCVICQDVMVFPMVVTCGHSFCGECNSLQSLFFPFYSLITLFICFLLQRFGRLHGLAACGGDLLSRVPLQYLLWGGDL